MSDDDRTGFRAFSIDLNYIHCDSGSRTVPLTPAEPLKDPRAPLINLRISRKFIAHMTFEDFSFVSRFASFSDGRHDVVHSGILAKRLLEEKTRKYLIGRT